MGCRSRPAQLAVVYYSNGSTFCREEEYLQAVLRAKQGPDSGASAASGVVSVAQQSYDDPAAIPDASPASGGIAQASAPLTLLGLYAISLARRRTGSCGSQCLKSTRFDMPDTASRHASAHCAAFGQEKLMTAILQTPELTADTPFQMPQQPRRVSKIYYATRTHSQIAQASNFISIHALVQGLQGIVKT